MYLFFQKTVYRFLYFLRTPDDHSFARVGFSFKINTLASLLLLNVVFASIWMVVIHVFGKEGLVNLNDELFKMPIWEMMLLGVVIIPFTEEIMFRFPMKYSRNYLLQFLIAMVALFAPAKSKTAIYNSVRQFWKRFFWVFFYLMTSLFAFIHLFNYTDAKHLYLWAPLLTMAQFVTGLIIGYLRVRFGFLWGWSYHAVYNLVFFSLSLVSVEGQPVQHPHPVTRTEKSISIKQQP